MGAESDTGEIYIDTWPLVGRHKQSLGCLGACVGPPFVSALHLNSLPLTRILFFPS